MTAHAVPICLRSAPQAASVSWHTFGKDDRDRWAHLHSTFLNKGASFQRLSLCAAHVTVAFRSFEQAIERQTRVTMRPTRVGHTSAKNNALPVEAPIWPNAALCIDVMTIHKATLLKLLQNRHEPERITDFFQGIASIYSRFADQLRREIAS